MRRSRITENAAVRCLEVGLMTYACTRLIVDNVHGRHTELIRMQSKIASDNTLHTEAGVIDTAGRCIRDGRCSRCVS